MRILNMITSPVFGYMVHMGFSLLVLAENAMIILYLWFAHREETREEREAFVKDIFTKKHIWQNRIFGYLHFTMVLSFLQMQSETNGQSPVYWIAVTLYTLAVLAFLLQLWECRKLRTGKSKVLSV